ncbi:MAG: DUF192 domain-containing protein [Alphaproteobacteria bacterium]|nr:DUF192 domain-containing protein [Alphaproteobacteria bacterium]
MRTLKFKMILFLVLSALSPSLSAHNLTISCPHREVTFTVELAQTPDKLMKGLMFRHHMEGNEGMLFLFPQPKAAAMWMKNTPLSLDMIFCDSHGKILAIHENTTPYSLRTIGPVENTAQVLEVLSGTIKKHEITKECRLMLKN